MTEEMSEASSLPQGTAPPRSLQELIDRVSGRHLAAAVEPIESGIVDTPPYPFLALVGQKEMKLALVLSLINPAIGGVLLVGPRGTGKTTAVRSLTELLPEVPRSLCPNGFGCLPEDIEQYGMDGVCPECAKRYGQDEPLAKMDQVHLFELPLNASLDDVVGGLDERAAAQHRFLIRRGILAQADRHLLYIDEVNLLSDAIIDAILDASAQGQYTVRRGPVAATYFSRFVLIGSMNPEEGQLRPQILDRFGLRLMVDGLNEPDERLEAYRRVRAFQANPHLASQEYETATEAVRVEIRAARDMLPKVQIADEIARKGLEMIDRLDIASLRAEITLFEAARAYAASDGRLDVSLEDLRVVAPFALRLRRSAFMSAYFKEQKQEEDEIKETIEDILNA